MKTRKFIAVLLLLAMSFSFMTISASADFSAHVDSGMFEDEETPQPTEAPAENSASGSDISTSDTEVGFEDAVVVPDEVTEEEEEEEGGTNYEGSYSSKGEIILGAQNESADSDVAEVVSGGISTTYTKWDDAIDAAGKGDTVRLLKNLGFTSLHIKKYITLDLNGYSITVTPAIDNKNSASEAGFVFDSGAEVKNGTLTVASNYDSANKVNRYYGSAIAAGAAAVDLKNVTVNYEGGKNGEGAIFAGPVLAGKGCVLSKNPGSGAIKGGFKLEQNADGSYSVVSTTPDAAKIGEKAYTYLDEAMKAAKDGDVVLVLRDVNPPGGMKLKDYSATDFVIDLGGCKFTGDIEVSGGKSLTIKNGTVDGHIYTDSKFVLGQGAKVGNIYLNGGKLEANAADASAKDIIVKSYEGMSLTVSAGSFNSIGSGIDTDKVAVSVTGGSYAVDPSEYVDSSNYTVTKGEDGRFTVAARAIVARIGSAEYNSFGKAVNAAKDGDEITILADLKAADFNLDKNLILNLNGKTLKSNLTVLTDKSLTVKDGILEGKVTVSGGAAEIVNASAATVDGAGKITVSGSSKITTLSPAAGELNIKGSSVSVENLYIKGSADLTMNIEGGSFGTFTKADDPSKVISRITGGVFATDPSGYVAKGYKVEKDVPEKGKFTVSAKEKASLTAPEKAQFMIGQAESNLVFTCSEDITDEIYINDVKLENDTNFTRFAVNGKELTLYKKYLNTLDAASYVVKVTPKNNLEKAEAGFVVLGTPALTCDSVPAVYVKGSMKPLVFKSNYPILAVYVDGEELKNNEFSYTDAERKVISLDGKYLNGIKDKTDLTLTVDVFITEGREESISMKFQRLDKAPAVITDSKGGAVEEIKFYKDTNDADKNELLFKVEPKVINVQIDGKDMNKTDIQSKADSVQLSSGSLKALEAGRHSVKFIFANGAEKTIPLAVYPSYTFSAAGYGKGSGKDVKVALSDNPDSIWVGKDAENIDKMDAADYSVSYDSKNEKWIVTLYSKGLEKLPEGAVVFSFQYDDVSAVISGFKINPAASIKPADSNKDCKWAYGSSNLSFIVSPDVKGVSVDGHDVASKNYSVDKNGVLSLKSGFLKGLSYGNHTLAVTTSDGVVSIEFTTKCGIEAKNGNTHTKGGKKDLEFVSSDPIEKVYVGPERLKTDYYTLSKDGKTLTLKAEFLNKLKADYTYELTVETEAGIAGTTFRILSPGSAASNPKTGDESGLYIWAAVLLLSGVGALALIPRRKKQ